MKSTFLQFAGGCFLLSAATALFSASFGTHTARAQTIADAIISPPSVIQHLQSEIDALQKTAGSQSTVISSLQATVNNQAGAISNLQNVISGDTSVINGLQSTVSGQASTIAALQTQANASSTITSLFTLGDGYSTGTELTLSGENLHIVNGEGTTDTTNGLGNLILGYNDSNSTLSAFNVGSHNLVLGRANLYASFGGIVGGVNNIISGAYATVLGGHTNTASGDWSFIYGGLNNDAVGQQSAITGGSDNEAYGLGSAITGGVNNQTGQQPDSSASLLATTLSQPATSGEFASVNGGYTVTVASSDSSGSSGTTVPVPAPVNTGIITIKP